MPAPQSDLFDAPKPPPLPAGLTYAAEVLTPQAEARLIGELSAMTLAPFRFQGWTGKRHTVSFGWRYDFEDASFARTELIPDVLSRYALKPPPSPGSTRTNWSRRSSSATIRARASAGTATGLCSSMSWGCPSKPRRRCACASA